MCDEQSTDVLIDALATAVSLCSEMLNGRDSMVDAIERPNGLTVKSPLTSLVDDALASWREWKFGGAER